MDLNKLEAEIKQYKSQVQFADSLDKLLDNRDFQAVILNGYLKDHVLELVKLRHAHPEPDNSISRAIDATANLMAYIELIKQSGATAREQLAASEQTLEEHYREE